MTAWRYIAQRPLTGEFLDWDVPLEIDETSWELSGPGALRGTVSPDVGQLRADDGDLLLEEWGTLLYAEADGVIRWGGILISSGFEGEEWRIEAAGFSSYPSGIPYLGEFTRAQVDAIEAFREVWRHVQSYANGNLGVAVTGTNKTGVVLGTPAIPAFTEYQLDGKWTTRTAANSARIYAEAKSPLVAPMTESQTYLDVYSVDGKVKVEDGSLVPYSFFGKKDPGNDRFGAAPLPFIISVGSEYMSVTAVSGTRLTVSRDWRKAEDGSFVPYSFFGGPSKATTHNKGTEVRYAGTPSRKNSGTSAEPYQLVYWEATDCGDELRSLASETPFDYVERHYWDGDVIRHAVEVGYPRLGRRRDDLAFVQGDNITDVVAFESLSDDYANEVVGIGAGEGRATLRRSTAASDGRLRRTAVYTDKTVKTTARMDAFIADELTRRRGLLQITSVEVVNHPNAVIGSWEIGDDVLISADVPWLGEVDLWCRITGWSLTGEHTARLTLARSDSFRYGG